MSTVTTGHRIFLVSYQVETIECICGERVTAEPDTEKRDRHAPLVEAWAEHKRASGVVPRGGGSDKRRRHDLGVPA